MSATCCPSYPFTVHVNRLEQYCHALLIFPKFSKQIMTMVTSLLYCISDFKLSTATMCLIHKLVCVLQEGKPKIYISHGTKDEVLSIDYCSRRLAPRLQNQGYDLKYHEFEGPHTVPNRICREGIEWFLERPVT